MPTDLQTAPVSKGMLWTGWVLSVLPALFLLFGGVMDLVKPPFVLQGTAQMGYPESVLTGLGVAVILCVVLYLIPRTSILGAILLTGYLGGAVATHVRMNDLRSIPMPILFAFVLWIGIYLREPRLRALVPLRS